MTTNAILKKEKKSFEEHFCQPHFLTFSKGTQIQYHLTSEIVPQYACGFSQMLKVVYQTQKERNIKNHHLKIKEFFGSFLFPGVPVCKWFCFYV